MTQVNYKGKVTVKIKGKPPAKRFNSGTNAMFNVIRQVFLLNFGKQDAINYPDLPQCIIISNGNYDEKITEYNQTTGLLNDTIPILSREAISDYGLRYRATLVNSNISNNQEFTDRDDDGTHILLLAGDQKTILAYVKASADQIEIFKTIQQDANSQCTIEWELYFSNSKES